MQGLRDKSIQRETMEQHSPKRQKLDINQNNQYHEWQTALGIFLNKKGAPTTPADLVSFIVELQNKNASLVEQNEKLTADLESTNLKLQKALVSTKQNPKSELENALVSTKQKLIESEAHVLCLERKNKQIMKLLEKTEQEACHMETKLARGEYNPRNTKVLHLAFNPEKIARKENKQAKIKELENENQRLMNQIIFLKKHVQKGGKGKLPLASRPVLADKENRKILISHDDNTPTDDITKDKIRQLQAEMNQEKLKMDRLKTVWHQKVTEFREACYELTGYKIDMMQNKHFMLRSMYAERESDHLLFCRNKQGMLQVLETEFCKTLDPSTLEILSKNNSLPAFISKITIDLFSQMTQY